MAVEILLESDGVTTRNIFERTTPLLEVTFLNDSSVAEQPDALTLKIIRKGTDEVVKASADILSSSTAGVLSHVLAQDDTTLSDQDVLEETHQAILEWEWSGSTRYGKKVLEYKVLNIATVAS